MVTTTVFVLYSAFGEFCYIVYGNKLANFPLILSLMPEKNWVIIVTKIIFTMNVIVSYPLIAYPAF